MTQIKSLLASPYLVSRKLLIVTEGCLIQWKVQQVIQFLPLDFVILTLGIDTQEQVERGNRKCVHFALSEHQILLPTLPFGALPWKISVSSRLLYLVTEICVLL